MVVKCSRDIPRSDEGVEACPEAPPTSTKLSQKNIFPHLRQSCLFAVLDEVGEHEGPVGDEARLEAVNDGVDNNSTADSLTDLGYHLLENRLEEEGIHGVMDISKYQLAKAASYTHTTT